MKRREFVTLLAGRRRRRGLSQHAGSNRESWRKLDTWARQ